MSAATPHLMPWTPSLVLGEDLVDTLVLDHLELTTLKLVDMKVTHQALYAMLPNLKFLSLVGCDTR